MRPDEWSELRMANARMRTAVKIDAAHYESQGDFFVSSILRFLFTNCEFEIEIFLLFFSFLFLDRNKINLMLNKVIQDKYHHRKFQLLSMNYSPIKLSPVQKEDKDTIPTK